MVNEKEIISRVLITLTELSKKYSSDYVLRLPMKKVIKKPNKNDTKIWNDNPMKMGVSINSHEKIISLKNDDAINNISCLDTIIDCTDAPNTYVQFVIETLIMNLN